MLYRILIIVSLITATVLYSLHQKQTLESQLNPSTVNSSVLSKLPKADFQTLDERTFSLHGIFENERVVLLVIHFWGTWCAPCEAELPELLAFMKRFEGRPEVKFLLVAVNDELHKVRKHIKNLNVPNSSITWLIDNANVYRDLFGTTRVPETYVFSSDKFILHKYVGPQAWSKAMFFQAFDEFLQTSSRKL